MEKKNNKHIILIISIFIFTSIFSIDFKLSILGIAIIFVALFISKPLLWIYFMITYATFEVLIQNFIPISLIAPLRYGTELFSYIILMFSILNTIIKKRKIKLYKYDKYIIIFIIFSIISAIINQVELKIFILGLRWIIRSVVIYYIFKFNNFRKKDLEGLLKYFYILIIIQLSIGILQFFFRSKMDIILKPKVIDLDFYTIQFSQLDSKYGVFSTFGRYGEYAYFITLAAIFLLLKYSMDKKIRNLVILSISIIVLILTYARQATLAVAIAILIYVYFNKGKEKISKRKISIILGIVLTFTSIYFVYNEFQAGKGILNESISQRYLSIFTMDYIKSDYDGGGRIYFLTTVNKKFIQSKPLIGYGVGMYGTEAAISYNQSVYTNLNIPTQFSMDVYWTSILGQVGIIGLVLLFKIYYSFYKESDIMRKSDDRIIRFVSTFIKITFIAIMIESFFSSSLSDRYQAFYVWMFYGIFDNLRFYNKS